jgi:hypothetical protein
MQGLPAPHNIYASAADTEVTEDIPFYAPSDWSNGKVSHHHQAKLPDAALDYNTTLRPLLVTSTLAGVPRRQKLAEWTVHTSVAATMHGDCRTTARTLRSR